MWMHHNLFFENKPTTNYNLDSITDDGMRLFEPLLMQKHEMSHCHEKKWHSLSEEWDIIQKKKKE